MTAKILKFQQTKSDLVNEKVEYNKIITTTQIFNDIFEDIIGEWQKFAIENRLNEYVQLKISKHINFNKEGDYINDLNMLSQIESKLNMKIAIFSPGATIENPSGWMVAFHYNKEIFSTPAIMISESYARALNILLYLEFKNQLKLLNKD